jgi:hypothetical protein
MLCFLFVFIGDSVQRGGIMVFKVIAARYLPVIEKSTEDLKVCWWRDLAIITLREADCMQNAVMRPVRAQPHLPH